LKNVVVSPINQNHIDIRAFQSAGGGNASEPAPYNYDSRPLILHVYGVRLVKFIANDIPAFPVGRSG
jgi:hypothetical protein